MKMCSIYHALLISLIFEVLVVPYEGIGDCILMLVCCMKWGRPKHFLGNSLTTECQKHICLANWLLGDR